MEQNRETIIDEIKTIEKLAGILDMIAVQSVLSALLGSLYVGVEEELSIITSEFAKEMVKRLDEKRKAEQN